VVKTFLKYWNASVRYKDNMKQGHFTYITLAVFGAVMSYWDSIFITVSIFSIIILCAGIYFFGKEQLKREAESGRNLDKCPNQ